MAYIDIGPWVTEHWWLTFWLAFWALIAAWTIATCTLNLAARVPSRILRSIMICARGWPPAHLDADGDWKEEPARPPLEREDLCRVGDSEQVTRYYREEKKS